MALSDTEAKQVQASRFSSPGSDPIWTGRDVAPDEKDFSMGVDSYFLNGDGGLADLSANVDLLIEQFKRP